MAIRTGMADLVDRTKELVDVIFEASPTFEDATVQTYLDRHQTRVFYQPLQALPHIKPGGTAYYRAFQAPFGDIEGDAILVDGTFGTITTGTADGATANYMTGYFHFGTQGIVRPVMITAQFYDLYGAAADLLKIWASQVKICSDFETQGAKFKRSQLFGQIMAMSKEYAMMSKPLSVTMVRDDIQGEPQHVQKTYPHG